MNRRADDDAAPASRRGFLGSVAGLTAGGIASGMTASATRAAEAPVANPPPSRRSATQPSATQSPATEPFWGMHQGGIVTPQQTHTYFAALDLVASGRAEVAALLRAWTVAAGRMTVGQTAQPEPDGLRPAVAPKPAGDDAYGTPDPATLGADSGEAGGLRPARLTVTFGFGAGLFVKDGKDRYGLARHRPEALIELPRFVGDQLAPGHTDGDLSIQACADDPIVAFHAVRQLVRIAAGVAELRWSQAGFQPSAGTGGTPRNLMGFKDGTHNPPNDPVANARYVWAGEEAPEWMRGGSYVVMRRIRIALEHWDNVNVPFQEQTLGRYKQSGAPLGGRVETDPLDLKAVDRDGNPVLPENSHVRLATAASNDGAEILRRGYSYNNGVDFTAERWPPWRQGLEYDAGLLFVCYQRDPRTGFVKIFDRMARLDMMNQFVTHVGGGLFACPPGAAPETFIGQALFAA